MMLSNKDKFVVIIERIQKDNFNLEVLSLPELKTVFFLFYKKEFANINLTTKNYYKNIEKKI